MEQERRRQAIEAPDLQARQEIQGGRMTPKDFVMVVKSTQAAMLQVMAQMHAGKAIAARMELDGSWTLLIAGEIERVLPEADVIRTGKRNAITDGSL